MNQKELDRFGLGRAVTKLMDGGGSLRSAATQLGVPQTTAFKAKQYYLKTKEENPTLAFVFKDTLQHLLDDTDLIIDLTENKDHLTDEEMILFSRYMHRVKVYTEDIIWALEDTDVIQKYHKEHGLEELGTRAAETKSFHNLFYKVDYLKKDFEKQYGPLKTPHKKLVFNADH